MPMNEFKPRGGGLLIVLFVLAISLPAVGVYGLAYFELIDLQPNFTDRILRQIGLTSVFSAPLMIVVYFLAKKLSDRINNDRQKRINQR